MGKPPGVQVSRVMFKELVDDLKEDYRLKNQKRPRVGHLLKFFDEYRAIDITSAEVKKYISHRQEEKAAPATINLELAALKRMFNLAIKETPKKAHVLHS